MKSKVILLLDDNSRREIKTSVSELSLFGVSFVNNLEEISSDMLAETRKVVVLEGYLQNDNCISNLKLFKALLDIELYFLTANEVWAKRVESLAHVYRCDITNLSFDMIQAAIFEDVSQEDFESESILYDTNLELCKKIIDEPSTFDEKLKGLAREFLAMKDMVSSVDSQIEDLQKRSLDLENLNARLVNENNLLTKGYKDVLLKAGKLNKTLKEYEVYLTKDIYTKINLHNYSNKPHVIYIKEYEELIHFNSFIETLTEVFRIQGKRSVKVVRLFDSSGNRKLTTLPSYYKRFYGSFLTKDVVNADYLCKSGDYMELLDILLVNRANLDLLIIIDSKDYNDTVISGSVLQLNVCRNRKHLADLGLVEDNTIVNDYDEENYLSWGHYPEFNSFANDEDRFLFLSSRPVIKKVYEMNKLFEEQV